MTRMKGTDWKKLTLGLIENYKQAYRLLMAAYDVLRENSIPLEVVTRRASSAPFSTMVHPAIARLTKAVRAEDQTEAQKLLLDMPVKGRPN